MRRKATEDSQKARWAGGLEKLADFAVWGEHPHRRGVSHTGVVLCDCGHVAFK